MASGLLSTSETIVIACDADLSQLTINYTGTGVAVRVGTTTTSAFIMRKTVVLPTVIAAAKSAPGTTTRARGFEALRR